MADDAAPTRLGVRPEVRITVEGQDTDTASLWDWLRHEPELRGRLRASGTPVSEEAMGVPIELVVVLATATVPVTSALARSLSTWLVQRRSDLTVTVTGPDGRQVSMSSRRVADPEKLLRMVLEPPEPQPAGESAPSDTSREP
jgi:Effector Associated Constant Component 1